MYCGMSAHIGIRMHSYCKVDPQSGLCEINLCIDLQCDNTNQKSAYALANFCMVPSLYV